MLLNYVIWTVLAHLQRTWPIKYDGFYPLYTVQKIKMVRSFLDIPYIHTFLWEYAAWVVYSFYRPHILYGFSEKWNWKMLCEPFSWSSMWNCKYWLSENRSESIYFTVEKMTVRIRADLRFIPCFPVWPSVIFTAEFSAVIKGVMKRDIPRFNLGLHWKINPISEKMWSENLSRKILISESQIWDAASPDLVTTDIV